VATRHEFGVFRAREGRDPRSSGSNIRIVFYETPTPVSVEHGTASARGDPLRINGKADASPAAIVHATRWGTATAGAAKP
jgi:hypothetical protein